MQKFKMYLSLKENRNLDEEKIGTICTSKTRPFLSRVDPVGSD
jgi:hypothetical protein